MFSHDMSHIINFGTCQHLVKTACDPCALGNPPNLTIVYTVQNNNNKIQTISFYKYKIFQKSEGRFALLSYIFLHTACLIFAHLKLVNVHVFYFQIINVRAVIFFHNLIHASNESIYWYIFM